jgi:hypothetical protein
VFFHACYVSYLVHWPLMLSLVIFIATVFIFVKYCTLSEEPVPVRFVYHVSDSQYSSVRRKQLNHVVARLYFNVE